MKDVLHHIETMIGAVGLVNTGLRNMAAPDSAGGKERTPEEVAALAEEVGNYILERFGDEHRISVTVVKP